MNISTKILLYILVVFSLLVAPILPQLNVALCSAVAVYTILRQRFDFFPLLLLTNIPITSFFLGGGPEYGSFEYTVEVYQSAYINIAGLPISAGLVSTVAIALVSYNNFLADPGRFFPGKLKGMFVLWNIGAFFAVLIAANGFLNNNEAWSGPLRAYLSTVGIFYGYAVAIKSTNLKNPLFTDFLVFFFGVGIIAVLGVFHHRILFLGAGFVPGLALIALRRKSHLSKFLGFGNLIVWGLYALAGLSFGDMTTFTLISLYLLSFLLGFIVLARWIKLLQISSRLLGYPAIIVIFAFMLFAIYGAGKFSMVQYAYSGVEMNLVEKIKFKIFDDRAKLWRFVWDDIKSDNKILPVPGEGLLTIHPNRGMMLVSHGAHNSYLQAIRENGIISGPIIILLMMFALVRAAKAYGKSEVGVSGAVAIGAISTLTIGAVTGHYVIGQTIGVYIFLLGGIAMAGLEGGFSTFRSSGLLKSRYPENYGYKTQ